MNAINQAQFPDPVQILPKENLLQIFSYLSQDDIDHSTKVCRGWRDSIQSDFSLFTSVEIKNEVEFFVAGSFPDPWWEEEKEKLEAMRNVIEKLSRFATLSTNRLNQVSIGLSAFGGSMPRSVGSWRFSRLSVVFDILTLSSGYLTRIQLAFPKMIRDMASIEACKDYISTILAKLLPFPRLKEVELQALPLFKVVSKSDRKKLTLSSWSDELEKRYWCRNCQPNDAYPFSFGDIGIELRLDLIMNEMNAFTGGQIVHLGSSLETDWEDNVPGLSGEVAESLLGSAEVLEQLEIQLDEDEGQVMQEVSELVLKCRSLTVFKLYNSGSTILHDTTFKVLSLFQLLQHLSFTLKLLEIVGVYRSDPPVQSLSGSKINLSALKEVKISGNAELIDPFCSTFQLPSLVSLHLDHPLPLYGKERIDMRQVYNLIISSANSLENLALSDHYEENIFEEMQLDKMEEDASKLLELPKLTALNLGLSSVNSLGPILDLKYPKLRSLDLSRSLESHRHLFRTGGTQVGPKDSRNYLRNYSNPDSCDSCDLSY